MPETDKIETASEFEREFKNKVSAELRVISEGLDRFVVVTPLTFGDGDGLPIVLKRENNEWVFTDEGHTFLQLSYDLTDEELSRPTRSDIIEHTLSSFSAQNRNGELILPVPDEQYGDALFSFVQMLQKIDDIRYLSHDRVRSTFIEDFKQLMTKIVSPARHIKFGWHDPNKDPKGNYLVDCMVNGTQAPLFVFALPNEFRAHLGTISLLKYETWGLKFKSVGIFEDQENINPRDVARFADAAGKTFSSLAAASEGLPKFFPELKSA